MIESCNSKLNCVIQGLLFSDLQTIRIPMNNPTPEEQADAIKNALFSGQKILAIKFYREQTGVGLAEAKDAVEKLEADLRVSSPERFTAKPAGAGCMSLLLAGVIVWRMFA